MPHWLMRTWPAARMVWGETGCEGGCGGDPAECLLDEVPLCLDCADVYLDRGEALAAASPAMREQLVRLWAEGRRPLPPPRGAAMDALDTTKLEELRRRYRSWAQAERVQAAGRCWALVPAGRCEREATVEGWLCETHAHGCHVPGLGWRDGEPLGNIVEARRAA